MAKRRFIIDFDEETNKKKIVVGDVLLLVVFGVLIALVVTLMLTAKKEKDNPSNVFADLIVTIVIQLKLLITTEMMILIRKNLIMI